MRLPQQLVSSPYFQFSDMHELIIALGDCVDGDEIQEIARLTDLGLPPVTSREVLGTMLGVNPGILWSFGEHSKRHYTQFSIHKGLGKPPRIIHAPRVGLKIIQKWLTFHLSAKKKIAPHVYGFVSGRSHISAAQVHCSAHWVYSVDIKNFFPTTPLVEIKQAYKTLGYNDDSASLLAKLSCLNGYLAQGAPTSPFLSNLVLSEVDQKLSVLAEMHLVKLSRYADDVVFSGKGDCPSNLPQEIQTIFERTPWKLSPDKEELRKLPNRLKVHGLLVHHKEIRLTKGYRNRIRAYRHLDSTDKIRFHDRDRIAGHLQYANQIDQID